MSETVEVPKDWLKRLMALSKQIRLYTTPGGTARADGLAHLQGYIESAETLISEPLAASEGGGE